MYGATTNYPINFANLRGIPMIASSSVTVNTDSVTLGIPKRAFRNLAESGILAFRLTQPIPTSGETLPIVMSSNDFTQALTMVGGDNATGANMAGTGVYLIWYDKCSSLMQLLTFS